MNNDLKEKVVKALTVMTLTLIVVIGAVFMYPNYRRGQSLKQENAALQAEIDRRKKEIEVLLDNQRRFRTDADFVEAIARQNHRMFPGELVFLFDKE